METENTLFDKAITAIDSGDMNQLKQLLEHNPRLLNARMKLNHEGYFKDPYLLWFIAGNPVRQEKLPHNIVEITRLIIQSAEANNVESLQHQIDYTLDLVCSSRIAHEGAVQKQLIKLLVEKGADPVEALPSAIIHGEVEAVDHLLEFGATLTLPAAISLKRMEDIKKLIGSASRDERQIALAVAAFYGQADTLALLIYSGVDINIYNPHPYHSHSTPLHQAVSSGSLDAVKVLVEAGADLIARDKIYNGLPLGWAIYGNPNQKIEAYLRTRMAMKMAEKLVDAGVADKHHLEKVTAILATEIQA